MSDKIREEFEAWAVNHKNHHNLPVFVFYKDHNGEYVDIQAKLAWQAWQASRAALVAELPVVNVYETGDVGANHKAYDCEEVKDAIDKAGVSYK